MDAPATDAIREHIRELKACRRCPNVAPPPVAGEPVGSARVMLVGQAPGPREREQERPFVWTAGTTLFRWLASIGAEEEHFRQRAYMAAVIRCFPGKQKSGGDRAPAPAEIANCRPYLERELALVRPALLLPVGKLAIEQFVRAPRLADVVGHQFAQELGGQGFDLIPLPHPSGLSTWHKTEPGKTLLAEALALIAAHPAWKATFPAPRAR